VVATDHEPVNFPLHSIANQTSKGAQDGAPNYGPRGGILTRSASHQTATSGSDSRSDEKTFDSSCDHLGDGRTNQLKRSPSSERFKDAGHGQVLTQIIRCIELVANSQCRVDSGAYL
jgi:hypothetical protein